MTKERGGLGKGLTSILGNNINSILNESHTENITQSSVALGSINKLPISQIVTNPFQPRKKFEQEKLHELAISIEQLGVIQPVTVRKMQDNKFQLISGERRLRASEIAGLTTIPAFIRIANDQEMLEMALVENIQRENLNPIEIALSYKRLIEEIKLTQEECSDRVGRSRSTVTNFLRLLKLPEVIQKSLSDGEISNGHARSLLSIQSQESQINLYHDIIANGYSVREVEQLAKDFSQKHYKRTSRIRNIPTPLPFAQQRLVHDLSKNLDTNIELKQNKKGKGKLIISFKDSEDLERIMATLKK